MLDNDAVGIVTLTGGGRIGQNRLTVGFAMTMADDLAHGARLVSLSMTRAADLGPVTVAHATCVTTQRGIPVSNALRDQHMLVLLVNLEPPVDGGNILYVSQRTAASLTATIIEKLVVRSRRGAVAYAIRNGLA